jgi:hypothetical protein
VQVAVHPPTSTRSRSRNPSGDHLYSADCSLLSRNGLPGYAARNAAANSSRLSRRRSFTRFCPATPGSWSASTYRTINAYARQLRTVLISMAAAGPAGKAGRADAGYLRFSNDPSAGQINSHTALNTSRRMRR